MSDEKKSTQEPTVENKEGKEFEQKSEEKVVPYGALHEERQKRKELQERLAAIEAEQRAASEKKLEEEGQYKELLTQAKRELEEARKEREEYKSKFDSYNELAQKRLDTALEKLSSEDKEFVTSLLDGKSIAEKETLLPTLLEKIKGKDNINVGVKGNAKDSNKKLEELSNLQEEYKQAKEKRNVKQMLRLERLIQAKETE